MKHSLLKAVLAGLVLASAASLASAAIKQSSIGNENGKLTRSDRVMALDLPGINCTGLRDDRAVIAAAVTGSGVAVGKTLDMSGCLALLSSPGANGCAVDIAANTKIVGDGALRTGFALARRYCSGGDTPGGACDATSDCQGGGTCVYDLDSTGSQLAANFAPSDGSIYKVVCSSAAYPEVSGVHIWGNQRSGNPWIMGGNDDSYGYCDGGTSDTEVCNSRCVGGSLAGIKCNLADNSECTGGGTCTNRQCNADGGTCRAWNIYTQHGGASGPGTIRAVDFDSASAGTISNVQAHDFRTSDYLFSTGSGGTATRLTMAYSQDSNVFAALSYASNPAVDTAVYARNGSVVNDSRVSAWNRCFHLQGDGDGNCHGATAIENTCSSQGGATTTSWPGTVGFYLAGVGNNAIGNRVTGGLICGMTAPASNIQYFVRNSCDLIPIMAQINGTHSAILDNRNAWVTQGPNISINEMRGLCSGGSTRAGKICLRQAPASDTGLGCPSGTCDVDTSRLANAGVGHFQISRNFMHQTSGAWGSMIATDSTKRCAGGANVYKSCTVAGDCPSSSCNGVGLTNGQISDNFVYGLQAGNTAFDFTNSAYSSTGMVGVLIADNIFQGTTGTAIAMPATASQASGNRIVGNLMPSTLTPVTNWDEGMGWADVKGVIADLPAAGCVGSTGYTYWDLPTTNPAVAACLGSNYARGVLAFADGANALSAYTSVVLPHLWSGSLYADIYWGASNTTTANVVWQITGACVADTENFDPTLSSTANTVTDAVLTTTANYMNKATITLSAAANNPLNTCAADEQFHFRLFRDPANGSDNSTATANLYRVVLRQ